MERVLRHYENGKEEDRLIRTPAGELELLRTQALIAPHVTRGAVVYDVGGGTGRYAAWLASLGCAVTLFDPVLLHVEQATVRAAGTFQAECADARAIPRPDASADVVLLLGPLYHLLAASDRTLALTEARRVLRPGGVMIGAGISRFAWLLDAFGKGILGEDGIWESVERTARGRNDPMSGFPAFFHLPEDFRSEIEAAGWDEVRLHAVEGFGFVLPDLGARLGDERQRSELLAAIALVDAEPSTLGLTSHFVAVARAR